MTHEIGIEVDLGAEGLPWLLDEWWRYTGSCAFVAQEAGLDLRDFHGRRAEECILPLVRPLWLLKRDPDYFPGDGGLLASLVGRLDVLVGWFGRNPQAMVKVAVWPEKTQKPRRAPRKRSTRNSTASRRRSPG